MSCNGCLASVKELGTLYGELTAVTKERDDLRTKLAESVKERYDLRTIYTTTNNNLTAALRNEQVSATAYAEVKAELEVARERTRKLESALKDLFQLMDDLFLVRNTDNDADPDWVIKVLPSVMKLKNAHSLIAGAEPKSRG